MEGIPMRIAVISDIHGNLTALEAVLNDLAGQPYDAMVCLGDLAYKGPQPAECVARVRSLGIPVIHGNTDLMLLTQTDLTPLRPLPAAVPDALAPYLRWHVERLSRADLAYLAALPFEHYIAADGVRVQFVHATPQDCVSIIQPTDPWEQWQNRVGAIAADWLVAGHIHRPYAFRAAGKQLINPGAVGFSLDGDWRASYAMLDTARGSITLSRVAYAIDKAVAAAREAGFCFDPAQYGENLRNGVWP
jgi:putative phosphoesterase